MNVGALKLFGFFEWKKQERLKKWLPFLIREKEKMGEEEFSTLWEGSEVVGVVWS